MDNFLSGNSQSFGIKQNSVMSGDAADLIFGGTPIKADASKLEPIKKEPIKKVQLAKIEEDEEEPKTTEEEKYDTKLTADDFLNQLDETEEDSDEPSPTPAPKPQPATKQEEVVEDSEEYSEFTEIAKELVKMGIFKERDEDSKTPIKTGEALRDRFLKESQERVNDEMYNFIVSKHGDEGLEVFNALFVKGVPIRDYLTKYNEVQSFENLDMGKEDNWKMVYREAYRRQGLAEDKIEKKLQRSLDYGDLEEEARDLHEVLVKQDREDMNFKLAEAQEAEANKRIQRQEYLNNMNVILGQKLKEREFDGIPVTEKIARETYDYLTNEKWQLPSGERLTDFDKELLELKDPKNHELRIKLALLMKNKMDLTKVKAKAVSADSNKLFNTLVRRDAQVKREKKAIYPGSSFLDNL